MQMKIDIVRHKTMQRGTKEEGGKKHQIGAPIIQPQTPWQVEFNVLLNY